MSNSPELNGSSENRPKPLQPEQVEKFLREHLGQEISHVAPLGRGCWSQAFSFRLAGNNLVIRFSESSEGFEKDRWAARFSSPDMPIPKVSEIGKTLGRYFAISERVFGGMLDELDSVEMQEIIPALFRMLDAMRLADLGTTSGYGRWNENGIGVHSSWQEFLMDIQNDQPGSKIHGWRASLAASPTGEGPFNEAWKRLKLLAGECPGGRHLVHTDLLYYNVLVADNKISAVVDWGNAMYGDFLYDLANFTFWSPWYPAMKNIDLHKEARRHYQDIGLDVPKLKERLRCSELHIGLAGMAWNAFNNKWTELEATAARTLDLSRET